MTLDEAIQWAFAESEYHDSIADSLQAEIDLYKVPKKVHIRPHGESWPRSPKGLGDALRRLAPALRLIGFECKSLPKIGGVIRWHIFSKPQPADPCPASPASPARPAATTPSPAALDAAAGHAGHSGRGVGSQAPGKGMPPSHEDSAADDGEVF